MWTDLTDTLDALRDLPRTVEDVATLMHGLTSSVLRPTRAPDRTLPWGRYLVHADPEGRYNLQLDVFSAAYRGEVHAHGTWGAFWILQGALLVTDCELVEGAAHVQRVARLVAGGCQCFCPPASDWHRVATPPAGPQTVSLHLYGPGFDLTTGVALIDGAPCTYRRGPLGEFSQIASAFVERPD